MSKPGLVGVLLAGMVVLLVTGCMQQTCNSYACSNPVTATSKVTSNRLDTLNEADIQVLVTLAQDAVAAAGQTVQIPDLTDAQAHLVVQFIQLNNIKSISDIQNLNPNTVVIPDGAVEALQSLGWGEFSNLQTTGT